MPLYEYRCRACGHNFETLRGLQERDEEVVCPKCGQKKAERLLSAFSSVKGGSSSSSFSSCGTGGFT
ncbi:MAG: zinc ribbon domain-containing protein [Deltaproteobacteria bacterium]|nr:MAG: zinc ribbon domain-containing protein [Deltaproteobacteria bacterium]